MRPIKKIILLSVLTWSIPNVNAQDTIKTNPLTFSGYIEVYYSYDQGRPANHERPVFFYSFNKHNEVNLNLGFLKANYNSDIVRGNFALMTGTYAQYNLSAEHPLFQHLFEANIGVKIFENKNVWVDAGIMPSHIGFEGAIGKDCWNLTRSILADNSPYYESGIKLSYTSKNENIYLAAMYLNGWQRIRRIPGNNTPAFGTQLMYKPCSEITLNWSTFAGNEKPDSVMQWRYFNNFYGQFQLTEKFGVTAGIDIGVQQMKKDTNAYNNWYSPVLIFQYKPTGKFRLALRGEYYTDEKGLIIATGTTNGFQVFGYSLNIDYAIRGNILCRIEGRGLTSMDKIFTMNNVPSNQNYFTTTSIAISF